MELTPRARETRCSPVSARSSERPLPRMIRRSSSSESCRSVILGFPAAGDFSRGFIAFQVLTCMRGLLFVPEGQTILAQQFIAGKANACRMSAVGTAEDPLSLIG